MRLEENRFKTIKKRRGEVMTNLSPEQQQDKGLIRKLVFEKSLKDDVYLTEEEKEQIFKRALNRYFLLYKIGKKNNNTCVEAVHSQMANDGEIWNILRTQEKWKYLDRKEVLKKVQELHKKIVNQGYPKKRVEPIIKELKQTYRDDELATTILSLKNIFEDYVGVLAQETAIDSGASCLVARKTRRILDANRVPSSRKIKVKSRLEFGYGLHLAEYLFLQKIFKEALGQKEMGEVEKPFLHIALHGKSDKPGDAGDIIIGNALRDGKMPCNPQIARWFSEKLNKKIKERDIRKQEGACYTSGVAIEGDRFCGSIVHCNRRYGRGDFEGMPLGENYQYIQVELSPLIRQNYFNDLKGVLNEVLQEFQEQFANKEVFEEFLRANTTEEDLNRLEGKMYYRDGLQESEEVGDGQIAMSGSLRRAFAGGLKIGDTVYIYNADNSGDKEKSKRKIALKVVSDKIKNRSEEQKVGYRKPAINLDTIKNLGGRNMDIVVEKKM